ncbi:alpha/beta hydrolase fold-domain-containing protein [Entophlyctis helioformis]|nr:alpha/beta hydrolase fold-domain-containing protein [Entophlyctis helioformis]
MDNNKKQTQAAMSDPKKTYDLIELARQCETMGRSSAVIPSSDLPVEVPPARPTSFGQKLIHALPYPIHTASMAVSTSLNVGTAVLSHLIDGPLHHNWSLSTTATMAFFKSLVNHLPPQGAHSYPIMSRNMRIEVWPSICGVKHQNVAVDVDGSPELSLRLQRALGIEHKLKHKTSDDVHTRWRTIQGEWVRHKSLGAITETEPVVFYLHGGAHHLLSPGTHRTLTAEISKHSGASVFAPDFRLAPKNPFPAAVEDVVACYVALIGAKSTLGGEALDFRGVNVTAHDPNIVPILPVSQRRVVVMGDSSGGGLAVQFLNAVKRMGLPMPAGAALLSPFLDIDLASASWHTNWNTDYLTADPFGVRWMMGMYANGLRRTHPAVSPIYGNLSGFPPILIQAGDSEVLRDDAIRFQARATQHGSQVRVELFRGMFHVFQAFLVVPNEAREAIRRICNFTKEITRPLDRNDSGFQATDPVPGEPFNSSKPPAPEASTSKAAATVVNAGLDTIYAEPLQQDASSENIESPPKKLHTYLTLVNLTKDGRVEEEIVRSRVPRLH